MFQLYIPNRSARDDGGGGMGDVSKAGNLIEPFAPPGAPDNPKKQITIRNILMNVEGSIAMERDIYDCL
jgi:hypothetical protein